MYEFVPGSEPVGFLTTVPAPPTVTGDVVVSAKTTSGTLMDGITVRRLPKEVVRFQGREIAKTAFYAKRKGSCHR